MRVSLATPDQIACGVCQYRGAPRREDAERLYGAARIVGALDQRRLQLSRFRRWSSRSGWGHLFAAVALTWPLLFAALISWLISHAAFGEDVAGAAGPLNLGVSSFILLVGIVVLLLQHRALRRACAAVPPAASGEPAACFLCGAPLASSAKGVARCGYCQADNVVDPKLLASVGHREVASIERIEAEVQRRAKAARSSLGWLTAVLASAAVVAPILLLLALVPLNQRAKDLPVRYAPWPREGTLCLGRIHTDLWGREFIGFSDRRYWRGLDRLEREQHVKRLTPKQLIGQVVFGDGGEVAKVVAAEDHGPYTDGLLVIEGRLRRQTQSVTSTCLAQPPYTRVVAILDEARPPKGTPASCLEVTASHILFGAGNALYLVRRQDGQTRILPTGGQVYQVEAIGADLLVQAGQQILWVPRYAALAAQPAASETAGARRGKPRDAPAEPFTVVATSVGGATQFGVHQGKAVFADEPGSIARVGAGNDVQKSLQISGAATAVTVHGDLVLWVQGQAIFSADLRNPGAPRRLAELTDAITAPWIQGAGKYAYVRIRFRVMRVPIGGGAAEEWLPVMPEAVFDFGAAGMLWAGGAPYVSVAESSLDEEVRLVPAMDRQRIRLLGPGVDNVLAVGLGLDTAAWIAEGAYGYKSKSGHPWLLVERALTPTAQPLKSR